MVLSLVVLATGCQRKADFEPIDIESLTLGFGSPVSETSETKADLKGKDLFTTPGTTFAVWANWSVEDPTTGNSSSASILKKQIVTAEDDDKDGKADKWTYSPLQYWHKSGYYDFRAIYPSDVSTISSSNGKTVATSYSMHTNDYDLMAAYSYRNMANFDKEGQYVNLTFRHALAAVCFKFQTGSSTSVDNYYLSEFYLSNLITVGTFVYDTEAKETDSPTPDFHQVLTDEWYYGDNEQSYYRAEKVFDWTASSNTERVIPAAYESFPEKWHLVIPQEVTENESNRPSVTFKVWSEKDKREVATTINIPKVQWQAGKKYIYYIQAQASQATITVKVTDWDEYKVVCDDITF